MKTRDCQVIFSLEIDVSAFAENNYNNENNITY
jgi:hypothetical protein